MKIKNIIVLNFLIILLIGCGVSNGKQANISLPTIMCGMCEDNIKNAVFNLDGVMKASVDLEKKTGTIFYDEKKISLTQIEEKIAAAGYKANNMLANVSAYEKLPRCCKIDG